MRSILPKVFMVLTLLIPASAFAQLGSADTGLNATVNEGYGTGGAQITSLPDFVGGYIIAPILGLTGTLLFALMTYAGFLWVTARGEKEPIKKAKDIITQCVVGTVILVGAYALANFVLGQVGAIETAADSG